MPAPDGGEYVLTQRPAANRLWKPQEFDPAANRTYHYWHVFVPGVEPGQIYGYRVQGASDPSKGMRFDPTRP